MQLLNDKEHSLIKHLWKNISITGLVGLASLLGPPFIVTLCIYYQVHIKLWSSAEWFFAFLLVSIPMSIGIPTSTILSVIVGYFIGWIGLPLLTLAYIIACTLGYKIGALIDGNSLSEFLEKKGKTRFINEINTNDFWIIAFSRLSPALPFAIMNIVFASLKVRMKNFLVAGVIGMLPRTILFLWVGTQLASLADYYEQTGELKMVSVVIITCIVVSSFGLLFLLRGLLKKGGEIA